MPFAFDKFASAATAAAADTREWARRRNSSSTTASKRVASFLPSSRSPPSLFLSLSLSASSHLRLSFTGGWLHGAATATATADQPLMINEYAKRWQQQRASEPEPAEPRVLLRLRRRQRH